MPNFSETAHGPDGDRYPLVDIKEHTATPGQQTVILDEQTTTLAEHGGMLREILDILRPKA